MMNIATADIEKHVKAFCAQIGADPLLVQGAGGNVSWKDGGTLWVKASGTWLAEAESKEIFVPVDLTFLQAALTEQNFSVKPEVTSNSDLRPSIETLLHALMPHRVVVHLHAVEILAHLVQVNARQKIKKRVGDAVKWIYVDYFKPGADLARAVSEQLTTRIDADVVFLGNHGVVIAGKDVEDVVTTLHALILKLKMKTSISLPENRASRRESDFLARGYVPCVDKEVSLLVTKDELINRLRHEWALYPDHVVFLGAEAVVLERNFRTFELDEIASRNPPFIFAGDEGVYENIAATPAQESQLRCYFDVVARQGISEKLTTLSDRHVSELLNWDAEKYRQSSTDHKLGAA
jgi:rhamnose utilization protein RhaD (predicted bifunctional aldolase and dehydrogenase)